MNKFRKKPVVVEAVQWFQGDEHEAVSRFVDEDNNYVLYGIETLEGFMQLRSSDWIIKGVKGEFYPCRSDIFVMTYEPVS